jgi:hypothetical protein
MIKNSILLYLCFVSPLFAFSQAKTDTVTILSDKVKIVVPKELSAMSDATFSTRYPNAKKPILTLSDESGEVNLIGDMTPQPAAESQLTQYKDFRIANLKKSWPDLKILSEGVKTVNGKKIGYFKFITQMLGQKTFNYYFFMIVDGKILLFTFNCTEKLQKDWETRADDMVTSVKIK